jgi:hypothetical protein
MMAGGGGGGGVEGSVVESSAARFRRTRRIAFIAYTMEAYVMVSSPVPPCSPMAVEG